MIDVNKPVRTRDGCNARIVATDLRNRNGDTILALITPPDAPYEFPRSYQPDGRYVVGENSERDLVPIPVQLTLYFNMGTAYGEPHRARSEEHTTELQSLLPNSYAVFCFKKKTKSQK